MRRLLALVSSIVMVETIYFSALSPILPSLTEEFGLSKTGAGVLVACYAIGGLLSAVPAAWLTTRLGVKPTVLIGLAMLSLLSVVFGYADSSWVADLARLGQGFGAGLAWTGGLTWLISASPTDRRGEMIGVAMGAAVFGALLGPVLGGVAALVGRGPAFAAVGAFGIVLGIWAAATPAFPPAESPPLRDLVTTAREPLVAAGMWFLVLPSLLLGVLGVLGPLRLDELGVSELGIGIVFLVSAAIEVVWSPVLGRLSDRHGRLPPIRFTLVAATGFCLLLPWPANEWVLAVLVCLGGIAFATFFVPGTTLLSDGAEAAGIDQAFGFALLNVGWAPGAIVGAALGAAFADALGDAATYLLLAGVCALTLLAVERGPLSVLRRTVPAATAGSAAAMQRCAP